MGLISVSVDVSELEAWQQRIATLADAQKDQFFRHATAELANRLLALVIPRTPSVTGNLRRGWLQTGGGSTVSLASIQRTSDGYSITITNPVYYASYVEEGHRQEPGRYVPALGKRLVASWVEGQHFLKISEQELENAAPGILQGLLDNFLRTVF